MFIAERRVPEYYLPDILLLSKVTKASTVSLGFG